MKTRIKLMVGYYIYILVVWGLFRYFARLPMAVEELCFKPILWLSPIFWLYLSYKGKLKLFNNGWYKATVVGFLVGLIYFFVFRFLSTGKVGEVSFPVVLTSLVTAVVEQIVFSGFILPALIREIKNESLSLSLAAVGFGVMRIPVLMFVFGANQATIFGVVLLASSIQMINGFVRLKTNNTLSSILAHAGLLVALVG